MKTVCKKLLCLMLVAMMLVSAVPFAFAAEGDTHKITIELYIDDEQDACDDYFELSGWEDGKAISESFVKKQAESYWSAYMDQRGLTYSHSSVSGERVITDDTTIRVRMTTNEIEEPTQPETPTQPSQPETPTQPSASNYGTLTVTVFAYNAEGDAKQAGIVEFTGKSSYTINRALAEECLDEVGIANYEEYYWQGASGTLDMTNGKDYDASLVVDPIRTPGNRKLVTLKIVDNDGTSHYQTVETLAGTKILDVLSYAEEHDYFDKPTRKGYRLAGYSFDMNCSNDVNRDDVINADMTIYCEWEKTYVANKYDVTLRVYTNGDTQYVDKVLDLEDYADDGKITRAEVESLLNKKYTAKSGYSLAYYGLFTAETWDDGDYDTDDAVSSIKVNEYGKTVIYVMVKNVKKAVADSSNPKTGDNIMIAATTLALSAAALVSVMELKKRKMI